jgi:hypothetical protein
MDGFVQADAAGKRNANIGMAHKAAGHAGSRACRINFGHDRSRSSRDIVQICFNVFASFHTAFRARSGVLRPASCLSSITAASPPNGRGRG